VLTTVIDGLGLYEEMRPELVAEEGRKVVLLKLESGGHNIGRVEGLQDVIGKMFGLY
jgi:abhydrolase domain-containing protein 12